MEIDKQLFTIKGVKPVFQRRSVEMLATLLDVSERLLCTQSFEDLSLTAIAADAGVTVGAFYSRFDSKEALYKAMHMRAFLSLQADLPIGLAPQRLLQLPVREMLREIVAFLVRHCQSHEGLVRATI